MKTAALAGLAGFSPMRFLREVDRDDSLIVQAIADESQRILREWRKDLAEQITASISKALKRGSRSK